MRHQSRPKMRAMPMALLLLAVVLLQGGGFVCPALHRCWVAKAARSLRGACGAAVAAALVLLAAPAYAVDGRRVFSVGDLHGDYESTVTILRSLGVMGSDGGWTGGNSILVQTGDMVDRGDESGPIFRALFRLQDEAPRAGGKVFLLMGNHELMNLQGDFRYATPKDTASLLEGGTESRPPGLAERAEVFSPTGWLGKEVRSRLRAVALVGPEEGLERSVLFVHAGLLPGLVPDSDSSGKAAESRLNSALGALVNAKLTADEPLLGEDGPMWTRRLALGPEPAVCREVDETLQAFGASRMVVGHTAQADGKIHERCGGRFVLGDSLISRFYTGTAHPSAIEFFPDGSATALYPGRPSSPLMSLP
ncbi:unnamed protein product [Effrenium voratum]|nr:unnamed protein product [Effrenium voratum]